MTMKSKRSDKPFKAICIPDCLISHSLASLVGRPVGTVKNKDWYDWLLEKGGQTIE